MKDLKVIIDLWNGWIKWLVLLQDETWLSVLAKEMVKTKGMRKWKILDPEEFVLCLNDLVEQLNTKVGDGFVDNVIVGVSHPECVITRLKESKRILNNIVEPWEINQLSTILMDSAIKTNYEILKIVPVQWIIDEELKVKDPLGMEARKLELTADIFQIPRTYYQQLVDAFVRLDIHVADIIPNILWSADAALDAESKDLGTLLIDIWSNQTSYVIYEEGVVLTHGVLPIGGEDVTKDISIWLQVDINEAEMLKREKWIILLDEKLNNDDGIDKGFLSNIMTARYEEILEYIQQHLIHIQRDSLLAGGVHLIGWASQVLNLHILAKQVFKLACFMGKDKYHNLGDLSENPQFINSLGLHSWSAKFAPIKWSKFSFDKFKISFDWLRWIIDFLKKIF